jgi:hypothetical protein
MKAKLKHFIFLNEGKRVDGFNVSLGQRHTCLDGRSDLNIFSSLLCSLIDQGEQDLSHHIRCRLLARQRPHTHSHGRVDHQCICACVRMYTDASLSRAEQQRPSNPIQPTSIIILVPVPPSRNLTPNFAKATHWSSTTYDCDDGRNDGDSTVPNHTIYQ